MKIPSTSAGVPDWNRELVSAWVAFVAQSDCQKNLNRLGRALDSTLRICRPAESFGPLCEHAEEIRQNAHILLLHGDGVFSPRRKKKKPRKGYLVGNKKLRAATLCGDEEEINRQLLRSVLAVLNHCGLRLRRSLARERKLRLCLEDVLEEKLGICLHPSALEPANLDSETRREFILELLREAAGTARFSKDTLDLATRVFGGHSRAFEIARELNVSKAAISQRLKPVRTWLQSQHPSLEIPFA